jgi:hypothetical protein
MNMAAEISLDVALIHYPVMNRNKEIIGSAVTNLDLHDIARAGHTFGVRTYWIVTPDAQQQELAGQIIGHWTKGYGGTVNPDRAGALSLTRVCSSLSEVISGMTKVDGQRPLLVATSAVEQEKTISFSELKTKIVLGVPVLLLFGTAWGLAPEIMAEVDAVLPPVKGGGSFNHLSVRSAASITLDRLLGNREDEQ